MRSASGAGHDPNEGAGLAVGAAGGSGVVGRAVGAVVADGGAAQGS